MPDSRVRPILDDHWRKKEIRAIEEPHWREIAAFLRPDDRDFDAHIQRRRDDSPIYNIEPILATEDFEGGFFSNASNPMNRWMEYSSGDAELDKYQPVKAWLWRRSNQALASFSPSVSAFYAEMPDFYGHICCFGWSSFYSAENLGRGSFIDRSFPINESFIATDANGRVNEFNREFNLTGKEAKRKWPDQAALIPREDARYVFVHAMFPNPDFRPGRLGSAGMKYRAAYVSPDLPNFYIEAGYYEFPVAVPRWKRRSGRPYPTGIGHTIRAGVVVVNEIERSALAAQQFAAEPPLLVQEKAKLLAADVEPNALLYGTVNPDGKPLALPLSRGQNLPITLEALQEKIQTIRRACRWGLTQLLAQRPGDRTATEFLGLQKADLELMGPGLVRVQHEGLAVIAARRFNMMQRAGLFDGDPPPPELAGRPLSIKMNSPLAKMLKVSDAQGAMQWVNAMLPVVEANPNNPVLDNVDWDEWSAVVHDGFSSDPSIVMDPKKRDAMRAQRAAQQAALQKLQMADTAANIHATVAHANQAQTLAAGRQQ